MTMISGDSDDDDDDDDDYNDGDDNVAASCRSVSPSDLSLN